MSKGYSGLFAGTKGCNPTDEEIKQLSRLSVIRWAKQTKGKLSGKAKKTFNTACVVYDEISGRFFYGRNGGYLQNGYIKNPLLFGDDKCKGILPETSLNKYPVGNCAEVDAVNNALNSGAELSHLHLTTIHVTKSSFGKYKESCENCTYAFRGRVKKNYSGWKEGIKP